MAFLTDNQCLQSVADLLKVALASLPSYWTNVVSEAHTSAYQEIVGRLLRRGYTKAQIDQWDRGAEFERSLTLFWSAVNGGGLANYDDKFIARFDRRKELDEVLLSIGGVYVYPNQSTPGTIGTGGPNTTRDIFVWPDPDDDSDRGHPTRF